MDKEEKVKEVHNGKYDVDLSSCTARTLFANKFAKSSDEEQQEPDKSKKKGDGSMIFNFYLHVPKFSFF